MTTSIDTSVAPLSGTQGGTGVNNSSNTLTFGASTSIDSSGRIATPSRPGFAYYLATDVSNVTGNNTNYSVVFDTPYFNNGSVFDGTTFTAPVTGHYMFHVVLVSYGYLVGHTLSSIYLYINGTTVVPLVSNSGYVCVPSSTVMAMSGSAIINLSATDTLVLRFLVSGSTEVINIDGSDNNNRSTFSGYLLS